MSTNPESSDRDLVVLAKRGDEAAFAALCARYQGRVAQRVARRLSGRLRRKVSVADVMQESLATASQNLVQFEDRGEGAFGAWLGGIAEHKLREVRRRYAVAAKRDVRREISRGGLPGAEHTGGHAPTASTVAMAGERRDALGRAMGGLSPDHRRVLELLHVASLSTAETAALMQRSPEAVRKLYARALASLADLLEDDGGGHGDA